MNPISPRARRAAMVATAAAAGAASASTSVSEAPSAPMTAAVRPLRSRAVCGAIGAMFVQKYVIVVGTAFMGAWTIVLSWATAFPVAKALTRGASDTEVWIFYPTSAPSLRWAPIAWIGLGLIGTMVQLSMTAGKKRK